MIIEILRSEAGNKNKYWQSFEYEPKSETDTVATALISFDRSGLKDVDGKDADKIEWECNCLQKKCGACAMVINKVPRLACDARLNEFKDKVRLEPLAKFPLIKDLKVDRTVLYDNLKEIKLWFEDTAKKGEKISEYSYEASRCLQCGLCLEVCPNFYAGGRFSGMAAAVPAGRLLSALPDSQKKEAVKLYNRHFFEGCGKSLSCRDICPAGIDTEKLMVNSNAIAVWKRFLKE